ncbi:Putative membrane protein OS=Streptomyces glaucescens OX=1907 GN=SGLAU_22340 PE=4 SV=1 [Streptomyces glaucescens]
MAALAWLPDSTDGCDRRGRCGAYGPARNRRVHGDGPELDGYARFRAAMEKSALGQLTAGPAARRCA